MLVARLHAFTRQIEINLAINLGGLCGPILTNRGVEFASNLWPTFKDELVLVTFS